MLISTARGHIRVSSTIHAIFPLGLHSKLTLLPHSTNNGHTLRIMSSCVSLMLLTSFTIVHAPFGFTFVHVPLDVFRARTPAGLADQLVLLAVLVAVEVIWGLSLCTRLRNKNRLYEARL